MRVAVLFLLVALAALAGCADLEFAAANVPALSGAYRRVSGIAYGADRRERLDVYVPHGRSVARPVVVFWYGGSWQEGRKEQYRFVGAALAKNGFVTVVPDYRLYPAVKFPELMNDGAKAVAWVHEHAADYGADPNQIVLMGHSAGGHMAALLALDSTYLTAVGVKRAGIVGLIGLSGPYALDPNTDTLRTIFGPPYTPQEWQPVAFVGKDSPGTLLFHGLDDTVVSPSHAFELRKALEEHGVPVESHFYPGRGHADTIASFSIIARHRTPAFQQTLDFLGRLSAVSADPE